MATATPYRTITPDEGDATITLVMEGGTPRVWLNRRPLCVVRWRIVFENGATDVNLTHVNPADGKEYHLTARFDAQDGK